jgi:hypothetical protein
VIERAPIVVHSLKTLCKMGAEPSPFSTNADEPAQTPPVCTKWEIPLPLENSSKLTLATGVRAQDARDVRPQAVAPRSLAQEKSRLVATRRHTVKSRSTVACDDPVNLSRASTIFLNAWVRSLTLRSISRRWLAASDEAVQVWLRHCVPVDPVKWKRSVHSTFKVQQQSQMRVGFRRVGLNHGEI